MSPYHKSNSHFILVATGSACVVSLFLLVVSPHYCQYYRYPYQPETYLGINFTLDIMNDTRTDGWKLERLRPQWDFWFSYFDTLKNLTGSEHAQKFFRDPTILEGFQNVEGVWIAYWSNTTAPPESGLPYPTIVTPWLPISNPTFEIQIHCWLNGSARIDIDGKQTFPPDRSSVKLVTDRGWTVYTTQLKIPLEARIELVVNNHEDFILIDKIFMIELNVTATTD